jgi:23S rRNA (guanine745-N1)-methyltransferase
MLICTVRDCRSPLRREERRVACGKGHSFDVARSGYINLLQPQDRRSRNPGDTAVAVAARRRIHDCGVTSPLLDGLENFARPGSADVVLDAGCGEGFFLGSIAGHCGCSAHGVDISIVAADTAAKRYPDCEWVVANADRFLPYSDESFSVVLSITGRLNAAEVRRVLRPDGRLIVAVPAPDDLIELRGKGRDRVERTIAAAKGFRLIRQTRITTSAEFEAAVVNDILHSIYRPLQSEPARAMRLTLSLDLLRFGL